MTGAEERKVVSVLFCDLVGFTAGSEDGYPEDVRGWLAPYHETLRTTVERFGGTVEKFAGDAILAVFGAPRSHEDDWPISRTRWPGCWRPGRGGAPASPG